MVSKSKFLLNTHSGGGINKKRRMLAKAGWITPTISVVMLPAHAETSLTTIVSSTTTSPPSTTPEPEPIELTISTFFDTSVLQIDQTTTVNIIITNIATQPTNSEVQVVVTAPADNIASFGLRIPSGWSISTTGGISNLRSNNIINPGENVVFDADITAIGTSSSTGQMIATITDGAGGDIRTDNNQSQYTFSIVG